MENKMLTERINKRLTRPNLVHDLWGKKVVSTKTIPSTAERSFSALNEIIIIKTHDI